MIWMWSSKPHLWPVFGAAEIFYGPFLTSRGEILECVWICFHGLNRLVSFIFLACHLVGKSKNAFACKVLLRFFLLPQLMCFCCRLVDTCKNAFEWKVKLQMGSLHIDKEIMYNWYYTKEIHAFRTKCRAPKRENHRRKHLFYLVNALVFQLKRVFVRNWACATWLFHECVRIWTTIYIRYNSHISMTQSDDFYYVHTAVQPLPPSLSEDFPLSTKNQGLSITASQFLFPRPCHPFICLLFLWLVYSQFFPLC